MAGKYKRLIENDRPYRYDLDGLMVLGYFDLITVIVFMHSMSILLMQSFKISQMASFSNKTNVLFFSHILFIGNFNSTHFHKNPKKERRFILPFVSIFIFNSYGLLGPFNQKKNRLIQLKTIPYSGYPFMYGYYGR